MAASRVTFDAIVGVVDTGRAYRGLSVELPVGDNTFVIVGLRTIEWFTGNGDNYGVQAAVYFDAQGNLSFSCVNMFLNALLIPSLPTGTDSAGFLIRNGTNVSRSR